MEQRKWKEISKFEEIIFEEYNHIAKITINRPRYRNAFTPLTTWELSQAFAYCRESQDIRVVILTGAGDKAFCAGGDMHVKGRGGYIDGKGVPRLSVLDVQMQIRRLPKPVIAMVNGYAIGGGHVLHVMCDLTIASENAIFGQTGPRVGSFDAGFGSSYLARMVGQKRAREIWFLCKKYTAREAEQMGMVNRVVPIEQLEDACVEWAELMMQHSPLALRMIKAGTQCRARRAGWHTGACRRRNDALLQSGRGTGGWPRLPREAQARLRQVSAVPLNGASTDL